MLTSTRGPKPPSLRMRRIYATVWSCLAVAQWTLYATARHDRATFLAGAAMFTIAAIAAIAAIVRATHRTPPQR